MKNLAQNLKNAASAVKRFFNSFKTIEAKNLKEFAIWLADVERPRIQLYASLQERAGEWDCAIVLESFGADGKKIRTEINERLDPREAVAGRRRLLDNEALFLIDPVEHLRLLLLAVMPDADIALYDY